MALPMLVLYATSTLGLTLSKALVFPPAWLGYVVMSSFGLASVLSLLAGQIVNRIGSRLGLISLFIIIALAFTVMVRLPLMVKLPVPLLREWVPEGRWVLILGLRWGRGQGGIPGGRGCR